MTVRPPSGRRPAAFGVLLGLVLVCWQVWARPLRLPAPPRPPPAHADVRYGPHERNVLDVWRAKPVPGRARGTPLVVFFHGGGFRQGDKNSVPAWLVWKCLARGSRSPRPTIGCRTMPPSPARCSTAPAPSSICGACGRVRHRPTRIGASGNSAGTGIALGSASTTTWRIPKSPDAVLRQSSRVACLGVVGAQTSYDPRFIKQVVGGRAHEHPALRPFYGLAETDLGTPGANSDSGKPRRSSTPRPATRRSSCSTPRRTSPCPPTHGPARASITRVRGGPQGEARPDGHRMRRPPRQGLPRRRRPQGGHGPRDDRVLRATSPRVRPGPILESIAPGRTVDVKLCGENQGWRMRCRVRDHESTKVPKHEKEGAGSTGRQPPER